MKCLKRQVEFKFISPEIAKFQTYLVIFMLFVLLIAIILFVGLIVFSGSNQNSLITLLVKTTILTLGLLIATEASTVLFENFMRKKNQITIFFGMAKHKTSKTSNYTLEQGFNLFYFCLGLVLISSAIFIL